MTLRTLHRVSATVILLYAFVHIANHLASLAGVETHIAFMYRARVIYRNPVFEAVLLFCAAFQVGSGLWLLVRGWTDREGKMAWLQATSGAYLAFFLLVHVGAVLSGRAILNLDTNFYFAAAGFHVPPYQYFFAPYYFLAVVALFTHLGCAAYWQFHLRSRIARMFAIIVPVCIGVIASLLIVLSLAGMLQPVDIPPEYTDTYSASSS